MNRLGLSLVAFLALFIGHLGGGEGHQQLLQDIGFYFLLYTSVTLLLFLHLVLRPGISVMRRLVGIPLDIGVVAYLMHLGGELTSFTYPIFLWAIFGNGFRFGVQYLAVAAVVGFFAFLAVVVTTPFWTENRELSAGLLAGLIILPLYVSVLIRRLSEAKRQAEEASRVKSLFLASISHELRTPLNAVIGLSDVLVGSGLAREPAEMARTIGKSGRSLLSLINSLLDLSRMELGKKPQMGEFDLHDLLRDIHSMLNVQAQAKGVALALHLDAALPQKVLGSTRHLEEVLINLAGNAIKFTSHGYVLIEASFIGETDEGCVRLRFEVTDTGIGIAPEAQARIFESFTQADETIIDRFGGTGLGLSIARQLVEAHGGAIGVDSVLGEGSTFWFEVEAGSIEENAEPLSSARNLHVYTHEAGLIDTLRASVFGVSHISDIAQATALLTAEHDSAQILLVDERLLGHAALEAQLARVKSADVAIILLARAPADVPRRLRRLCASILPLSPTPEDLPHLQRLCASLVAKPVHEDAEAIVPARQALDVLVAEDNRTNQMVIAQILSRGGHRVTMVENGDQAVDALLNGQFDLVLMDLNMPVMNGLDASKFYQFATLGDEAVPIIALTADATEETARKCLDAGMRECLNKPIEARALLAVVDKYGARDKAHPSSPPPVAEPALDEPALATSGGAGPIDARAIKDLASLGGESFVSEIVSQFVCDAAGVLKQLADSVAQQDVDGFRDHAHALRSCAANVGAQAVYKRCLDLRAIEAHELAAEGARHLRQLADEFEQARLALMPHIR